MKKKDRKTVNINFCPQNAPFKDSTGLQQTSKIKQITKPGSIILWYKFSNSPHFTVLSLYIFIVPENSIGWE